MSILISYVYFGLLRHIFRSCYFVYNVGKKKQNLKP